MRKFFLTLAAATCCLTAGATNFKGLVGQHTTWSKANSPYIIDGKVLVDKGVLLTIEPGVEVRFDATAEFVIEGSVYAVGTKNEPITFTSNLSKPYANAWPGINTTGHRTQDDSLVLDYCNILYATRALQLWGDGENRITNSLLSKSKGTWAVYAITGSTHFENNIMIDCFSAVIKSVLKEGIVANNRFISAGHIVLSGDGKYLNVTDNYFYNCSSEAYDRVRMERNVFLHGYTLKTWGDEMIIQYNTFAYCETGVLVEGENVLIRYNTIKYNKYGLAYSMVYGGSPTIEYNCIDSNTVYNVVNYTELDIDLQKNYLGSSDSATIRSKVFDRHVRLAGGKLFYSNFLTQPDSSCQMVGRDTTTSVTLVNVKNLSVIAYPNPFATSFTISAGKHIDAIAVYNAIGVKVKDVTNVNGDNIVIDLGQVPQGLYIYKLSFTDGTESTGKIQKQ